MEDRHTAMSSKTHPTAMGQSSAFKWLGICLGVVILAFIAVSVFKVSVSNLFFIGALLACPLMHLWMMRGEHGRTMKGDGHKH